MEKFIFKKLYNNITLFFIISLISISLIIWIIQAINYLDIVSEDGHGLKIYFMYTLYSLPKIISRILLFIFFTSVFFIILRYEERNELSKNAYNIVRENFNENIVIDKYIDTIFNKV